MLSQRKYAKITVIFMLLSLLLSACGAPADADMPEEDTSSKSAVTVVAGSDETWTADLYAPDGDIYYANIWGEYIFYCAAGGLTVNGETGETEIVPTKYYKLKIGSEESEEIKLGGLGETNTGSALIQPDYEGNMYVLYGSNTLAKYDENGNELYIEEITNQDMPKSITVDNEGRVYFCTLNAVYLFNTDCTLKGVINCETDGCGGVFGFGDKVYLSSQGCDKISEISFNTVSVSKELTSNITGNHITGFLDTGFICDFNGTIYYIDKETAKSQILTTFTDCGIELFTPIKMSTLDDGRIVLITFDSDIVILSKAEKTDKQTITIGTFESSTGLQNLVAEFNRNSEDYKIVIKPYYDPITDNTIGGTGKQDAITQFNLDIMSGNCPDILNLNYDSIVTYADKGVFEDLTPYFEESGLEAMENMVEAYTFDGVLAALPATTQLHTLVGRSEDVEKLTGWTLDEMMEYVESHPEETVFAAGPSTMLEYCLKLNQTKFIDWENYTCSFESEEFYKILEFCSRFNGGDEIVNTYPQVNIARYDALLYEVTLASPSDYVLLQQLLNTENIAFVGFPTDSGSGTIVEENSSTVTMSGSYAIFSQSENKEAAWEFIEFLMTAVPEYDEYSTRYGYPVVNETREAYFKNSMLDPWIEKAENFSTYLFLLQSGKEQWAELKTVGDIELERRSIDNSTVSGVSTAYFIPFEEELEPIKELLENAVVASNNDLTIMNIILENAADYFSGEHTVQEAAKQIQSRVNLYINERK